MSNRIQGKTRVWLYRFIAARDGELCGNCGAVPEIPLTNFPPAATNTPKTVKHLELDHIDDDLNNNEPDNFGFLCKTCNVSKENRRRAAGELSPSAERERAEGKPATQLVRQLVNYSAGSAEMQANSYFEVDFRVWVLQFIKATGFIGKQDAIDSGAEMVGCSPTTTTKYMKKLTSRFGPLAETKDKTGAVILELKPQYEPK